MSTLAHIGPTLRRWKTATRRAARRQADEELRALRAWERGETDVEPGAGGADPAERLLQEFDPDEYVEPQLPDGSLDVAASNALVEASYDVRDAIEARRSLVANSVRAVSTSP